MRGNPYAHKQLQGGYRSIPACAGEPHPYASGRCSGWVYPRVCGGTTNHSSPRLLAYGLSPRVRGNPLQSDGRRRCRGSIPACAGEPNPFRCQFARRRVYPRVCGGTRALAAIRANVSGLSPRVRGNRPETHTDARGARSIPACAGEPASPAEYESQGAVYPRVCGGTAWLLSRQSNACGLSPRVRGNPR